MKNGSKIAFFYTILFFAVIYLNQQTALILPVSGSHIPKSQAETMRKTVV